MADVAAIGRLRLLIAEPTEDSYTDQVLADRIDETGDYQQAAVGIWMEKAAAFSALADVQEGESRRSLSQLYKNALAIREQILAGLAEVDIGPTAPRSHTRLIERL